MLSHFELCIKSFMCWNISLKIYLDEIRRPQSKSELTPMVFNTGLTHLDSEASKYIINK